MFATKGGWLMLAEPPAQMNHTIGLADPAKIRVCILGWVKSIGGLGHGFACGVEATPTDS